MVTLGQLGGESPHVRVCRAHPWLFSPADEYSRQTSHCDASVQEPATTWRGFVELLPLLLEIYQKTRLCTDNPGRVIPFLDAGRGWERAQQHRLVSGDRCSCRTLRYVSRIAGSTLCQTARLECGRSLTRAGRLGRRPSRARSRGLGLIAD